MAEILRGIRMGIKKVRQRKMKTSLATLILDSPGGATKAQPVRIEFRTGGSGRRSAANPVSASYSTVKTALPIPRNSKGIGQ